MITVCTVLQDCKEYSGAIFLRSLLAQEIYLGDVHLIVASDEVSSAALMRLEEYLLGGNTGLKAVTWLKGPLPPPPSHLFGPHPAVWNISRLRQRGLAAYLSRKQKQQTDHGLVFWDSDHDWCPWFLRRLVQASAENEHVASGIYAGRVGGSPCHYAAEPPQRPLTVSEMQACDRNRFNGLGGFWASRDIWAGFAASGGWDVFCPSYEPPWHRCSEDFWCQARLAEPAKLLLETACWHWAEDSVRSRLEAGPEGALSLFVVNPWLP